MKPSNTPTEQSQSRSDEGQSLRDRAVKMAEYLESYSADGYREVPKGGEVIRELLVALSERGLSSGPAYHDGAEFETMEEISNYRACQAEPCAWMVKATRDGVLRQYPFVLRQDAEQDAYEWRINGATTEVVPLHFER